jgi:hypothetical protein
MECDRSSYLKRYYRDHKSERDAYHRIWRLKNREKYNKMQCDYRKTLRERIIAIYGSKCTCCGESIYEFLSIDHIGGGGNKHRKQSALSSTGYYLSIMKEGYSPDKYRLLCFNCNQAIGLYGICPHKKGETVC